MLIMKLGKRTKIVSIIVAVFLFVVWIVANWYNLKFYWDYILCKYSSNNSTLCCCKRDCFEKVEYYEQKGEEDKVINYLVFLCESPFNYHDDSYKGERSACRDLAKLYEKKGDFKSAIRYHERSGTSYLSESEHLSLANLYSKVGDFDNAYSQYSKICYKDDIACKKKFCDSYNASSICLIVAYIFETEKFDFDEAKKYYKKSCDLRNGKGCNSLGYLYKKEKDLSKAKKFYTIACGYNDADGCNSLGILYEQEKDLSNAKKFYTIACGYNYGYGCRNLGSLYEREKDLSNAKKYYKKSCDLLDPWGCYDLAEILSSEWDSRNIQYYKKSCVLEKKYDLDYGKFCNKLREKCNDFLTGKKVEECEN